MPTPILFIINPIAGPRKDKQHVLDVLEDGFSHLDFDTYQTKSRGDAAVAAKKAGANGYQTVVAVGGDGTVNEVASSLVNTNVALGIIPRGSGNGLARALKIPFNTKAAINVVIKNHLRQIDIGKAAHRNFCAVSGIGFDARVSEVFDKSKVRGFFSYAWVITKELKDYSPTHCEVEIKDDTFSCSPFLVSVANTPQYGNGAIIAPKAQMDDGYFDLCLAKNMAFPQILTAVPRLFLGTIDKHPGISYFKVEKVTFRSSTPIHFHVDGEPESTNSDLTIEVMPKALKVCVPEVQASN
ncbi:MAG: diacylglycerol/lipid kinase family protein [bacterium]